MGKTAYRGSTRRARLPTDWTQRRRLVLRRDNSRCQLKYPGCQGRGTEVDHKVRGDNHSLNNLQCACKHCHAIKSGKEGGLASAEKRRNNGEAHPADAFLKRARDDLARLTTPRPHP